MAIVTFVLIFLGYNEQLRKLQNLFHLNYVTWFELYAKYEKQMTNDNGIYSSEKNPLVI